MNMSMGVEVPELPEVETIRRGLLKLILGKKVVRIKVCAEKSFIGESVTGEILGIRRFGKALVIDLEGGKSFLVHLRMTGQLIYSGDEIRFAGGHPSDNFVDALPNGQTRVIIYLDEGVLYFNDQRKFGFVKTMSTVEVGQDDFVRKLAPEPWRMTADELYERLQRHKKASVKAVILDQTVICGLGNIYADESLFVAKIHPMKKAGDLSRLEVAELLAAMCSVMEKAIEAGGSTMETYVKADGTKGDYLELFAQVFHRQGKPCRRCGGEIRKIKVAGRGTHVCPRCQKLDVWNVGTEVCDGAVQASAEQNSALTEVEGEKCCA